MKTGPSGIRRSAVAGVLLLLLAGAFLLFKSHARPAARAPEAPAVPILNVRTGSNAFAAHDGLVNKAVWTPKGLLLTAGRDHTARLWNVVGKELASFRGHRGPVLDVAMSPDGTRVLTASVDGSAMLWKADGTQLAVLAGHSGAVKRARFDAQGERLLTLGLDGDARLWKADGSGGKQLDDGRAAAVDAAFVGERILTRDAAGFARRYWPTGAPLNDPEGDGAIQSLAVPRRGRTPRALLSMAAGPVWDLIPLDANSDGSRMLLGHKAQVLDTDIDADTGRLATASLDGTARLWSPQGEALHVLEGHGIAVVRVRFAPDRRGVVTLGADGKGRIWSSSGELVRQLEGPRLRAVGFLASKPPVIWGIPEAKTGIHLWTLGGADLGAQAPFGRILGVDPSPDGKRLLLHTAVLGVRVVTVERWDPKTDGNKPPPSVEARAAKEVQRGDYLGAAGCADCHRKEYDVWAASNHARSLEPAHAGNVPREVRDEDVAAHPPGETSFAARGSEYVATTLGADGQAHDFRLGWVAGRARIRMYVTEMADGRRQVLPAMRSELTDSWFDYTHLLFSPVDTLAAPIVHPGDDAFWTGQGRSWGSKCAHCHSSGAEQRAVPAAGGPRAVFRDLGVDCEACHGPGRAHAEAWRRMRTDAPLPKLQELERDRSIASCTRCHMEGERLQATWDPREDFYEFLDPTLLLDPDRVDARGRPLELVYHGLSFGISRCANEGGLTCARCHDAHGGELPALLSRAPTNDHLCATCHIELVRDVAGHSHHDALQSGGTCRGCHMPRLVIERGHGVITDHSISVPDPAAQGDRVAQDACTWCHQMGLGSPAGVPYLDSQAISRAYKTWWPDARRSQPWMEAISAGRMKAEGATAALTKVVEDPQAYRLVRASATRLLGRQGGRGTETLLRAAADADPLVRRSALTALAAVRSPEVDALYLRALKDPKHSVRSAAARAALEGWARVRENRPLLAALLPVLEAEAKALPNDEMRWFRLGSAHDVSGDVPRAIEAYERMLALHPLAASVKARLEVLRAE